MTVPTNPQHTHRPWARRLLVPVVGLTVAVLVGWGWSERERLQVAWWVHTLANDPSKTVDAVAALEDADPKLVLAALRSRLEDENANVRYAAAFAANSLLPARLLTREQLGDAGYQESLLLQRAVLFLIEDLEENFDARVTLPCLGLELEVAGITEGASGALNDVPMQEIDHLVPARLVLDESEEALDCLLRALRDSPDPWIRRAAAEALGHALSPLPEPIRVALREAATPGKDPDLLVRHTALRSLLGFQVSSRTPRPLAEEDKAPCMLWLKSHLPTGAASPARGLASDWARLDATTKRVVVEALTTVGGPRPPYQEVLLHEDRLLGLVRLPPTEKHVASLHDLLPGTSGEYYDLEPATLSALAEAIDDLAWLPEIYGEEALESPDRLVLTLLVYLRHDPERALRWLSRPGMEEAFETASDLLFDRPQLQAVLARAPNRAQIERAAGGWLDRVSRGERPAWGSDLPSRFATSLLGVLFTCGGGEATAALERFARSDPPPDLVDEQGSAAGMVAVLRGQLPQGLNELRAGARRWLRDHMQGGQAGAERVHDEDHPCGQQGRIPYRGHRTPLACLALLGEDDAPTLLAPTVRWLADPAQDVLGVQRRAPTNLIADGLVSDAAAVGDIPRCLEEGLVLHALHRAAALGIEAEVARSASKRRVDTLRRVSFAEDELDYALFALAAASANDPAAIPRALRLRERGDWARGRGPWEIASRRWLKPAGPWALQAVLVPLPFWSDCDPWLTTQGLIEPGSAPRWERRRWLWDAAQLLWKDRRTQTGPNHRPDVCPGAIIRVGQEDPVVLTAWVALAVDALEQALANSK